MTNDWEINNMPAPEFSKIILEAIDGNFDYDKARAWTGTNMSTTVMIAAFYLISIFAIESAMSRKKAFELRQSLAAWNFAQSLFSAIVVYHTFPEAWRTFQAHGLREVQCDKSFIRTSVAGPWHFAFVLSKVFDLVDTFFIVFRKRPLIFLHYYHHAITMPMGFYGYWRYWPGQLITSANGSVHTFMYFYYGLRALDCKVPGWVAKAITKLQISQFVVAMAGGIHYTVELTSGSDCVDATVREYFIVWILDLIFLYLFVDFFRMAYIHNGGRDKYKDGEAKTFCVPDHVPVADGSKGKSD